MKSAEAEHCPQPRLSDESFPIRVINIYIHRLPLDDRESVRGQDVLSIWLAHLRAFKGSRITFRNDKTYLQTLALIQRRGHTLAENPTY